MKIVVFGGSGFLGSHVADAISDKGHEVVVFDLTKSPYLRAKQEMVVGNILDEEAVDKAISGADIVYNFAGIADIDEAHGRPLDTVKINVLGNTIILEACRRHKIKRFVFASSVYVYSQSGSFYRNSKESCELIIDSYREVFGLPYTILRYGSLYGPRAGDQNWVHRILKQALTEKKITRCGDGEEIREYIHAEDAARCSVDILASEYENENVIITGHQPMKIKSLLKMIKEMMGKEIEIEYVSSEEQDIHYNISPYSFNPKIGKKLVSNPYLDLGQGILNILAEIHMELTKPEEKEGLIVRDS